MELNLVNVQASEMEKTLEIQYILLPRLKHQQQESVGEVGRATCRVGKLVIFVWRATSGHVPQFRL